MLDSPSGGAMGVVMAGESHLQPRERVMRPSQSAPLLRLTCQEPGADTVPATPLSH